jgi:preprotein translocase subunit SecD
MRVSSDYAEGIKKSAIKQAIETIKKRIDENNVAEPTVISKGEQIIVELPGLEEEDFERVKTLIAKAAKLEFKIVHEAARRANRDQMKDAYMTKLAGFVAQDDVAKSDTYEISVDNEEWRHKESGELFSDYYLIARDKREVFMKHDEADKLNCKKIKPTDDNYNPKGRRCTIPGHVVLRRYLKDVYERKPEFKVDDEHQMGYELITPENTDIKPYWRTYYLYKTVELGGSAVSDANVRWDPNTNKPETIVNFTRWGGRRFGELTGNNVGRRMAIILDDLVMSAPTIQTRIDQGSSSISMGEADPQKALDAAEDLVSVLRTGSLPAPLRVLSENKVGPMLGPDAVAKTQFSFLVGSLLVVIIMVFYYRFSGMLSILALALNILFMVAILAAFGATLTLPGIAAVVLTVGMAVDANIIIYERIREELRAGKSVKGAVDAGFSRGFAAILDGQLTTGVAGYVLYQYGSGPIRGFAVMLMIGIICTLFTATWVTRLFFESYVGKGRNAKTIAI